jgi:four helix bundle protein
MKVKSFKELDVWKLGIEIVDFVYEITNKFPPEEKYGLSKQMQRAAISVPSNIAEGFARNHTKEFKQFCFVSLGSCSELEMQLIIAHRRNFVSDSDFNGLEELLDHESRMLMNLIKSLHT